MMQVRQIAEMSVQVSEAGEFSIINTNRQSIDLCTASLTSNL